MDAQRTAGEPYWYSDQGDVRAISVMEALRSYRSAEVAMRRRTREAMDMGENELLVLRMLMRAQGKGDPVTPVAIARHLGITSASTTALLDRLARSGHIERSPNPEDRRSVLIAATEKSDLEIRHTLTTMHTRMMEVVEAMDADERRVVVAFLSAMERAVEDIDA